MPLPSGRTNKGGMPCPLPTCLLRRWKGPHPTSRSMAAAKLFVRDAAPDLHWRLPQSRRLHAVASRACEHGCSVNAKQQHTQLRPRAHERRCSPNTCVRQQPERPQAPAEAAASKSLNKIH